MRDIIQAEAVETALKHNYGSIGLPMRSGKTRIGLLIANQFNKVLVSYPNAPIFNSWMEDSNKFGIPVDNVTFTTHISLNKHNLKSFDCVILDEIHDVSINQWLFIEENMPVRMYGLSGTLPNKGEKLDYLNLYCPVIYKKSLDETTGKLNKDYKITVHLLEPDKNKNIKLKSGNYWSEAQKIAFFDRKYEMSRNFKDMLSVIRAIQDSPTKTNYMKQLSNKIDRGLFFVETAKHCEELGFESYHSKNSDSEENLEKFKNGTIHKLATINQLKAGITIHDLNDVVILHCYSSNNKAAQKLARALNYVEDMVANIHILCLKGTRDEKWVSQGLIEFDQNKIKYEKVNT